MQRPIDESKQAVAATMTLGGGGEASGPRPTVYADRYVDEGALGVGGMGEVRRVWDRVLDRPVALKLIHAARAARPAARRRFLAEARLTASLQHPGIVAVHDMGTLEDGRAWFTMREVRGETLAASQASGALAFRRLIEVFARVCAIVGYAHERGIVHRDLKPENIMLGEYGEVSVLDWGIASVISPVASGQVMGTPAYMAPEQARGGPMGPSADVYALGMVLRELLTGGLPLQGSVEQVLEQVAAGPPPPITGLAADREELGAIVHRSMAADPLARFPNAKALGKAVEAWLDGARKAERAQALADEAAEELPAVAALRAQATELEAEATAMLSEIPPYAPDSEKLAAWRTQDAAREILREATLLEAQAVRRLQAALMIHPDLPAAHAMLADHHRRRATALEERAEPGLAAAHVLAVRTHDRAHQHARWLAGTGRLTLDTTPSGVSTRIARFEPALRRLALGPFRSLGRTPIDVPDLRRGSYIVELEHPEGGVTAYPVVIERGGSWPQDIFGASRPIPLPPQTPPEERYVPAGPFQAGGDPLATDGHPARRLWVAGFIIQRDPVTTAEYAAFLNGLIDSGVSDESIERCHRGGDSGIPHITRERGRFRSSEGRLPVTHVTWHAACRYAQWYSEQTGRPWRLPHDLEWEKAARGVDARLWPWGNHAEPSWARVCDSSPEPPRLGEVDCAPLDVSVYGVRGLTGNVRDWCLNPYQRGPHRDRSTLEVRGDEAGDLRIIRGGHHSAALTQCRPAGRYAVAPDRSYKSVGFRLARSWP